MSADEAVGYVLDTVELKQGFDTATSRHRSETYFRYGYQIDGGNPIMVSEYGRSEIQSSKLAQASADHVRDLLSKHGSHSDVRAWVQEWTSQTVISYSDAKVVVL